MQAGAGALHKAGARGRAGRRQDEGREEGEERSSEEGPFADEEPSLSLMTRHHALMAHDCFILSSDGLGSGGNPHGIFRESLACLGSTNFFGA